MNEEPNGSFYVSRVHLGLCQWIDHEQIEPDLAALMKVDPFAYADLEGLRRDAEDRGGLARAYGRKRDRDYRTPLLYAPHRVTAPPWLGELKVSGKPRPKLNGTRLEWRLYFGEPAELPSAVVACGIGSKDPLDDHADHKQEQQVRTAMGRFKHYCAQNRFTYQPFPV